MKSTYLVTLDEQPGTDPITTADLIQDLLSDELPVLEVKPWARPSQGITSEGTGDTFQMPSPLDLPTL